jgi:nucleoside-diphosphate-sugar epimerase
MRVLVTGADGFVGQTLLPALARAGHAVRAAVRAPRVGRLFPGIAVGDIGPATDWSAALEDIEGVIHLAGRAHVMREATADPLAPYRRVNVEGTRRLAMAAAAAGVRRFVFVSSIKVNGERTGDRPFTAADRPCPEDAYGLSKWEAEQVLGESAVAGGMETVVLRPPLVYGPGVKGNFLSLLRLCDRGWPLPLGAVRNARSLVYVGNLADALVGTLGHPAASGRTFLVKDGEDVSVPELVRRIAAALGRPARLLPVPPAILRAGAAMAGRSGAAARLLGSLTVDDRPIREILAWQPPFSMLEGLRETAAWFRSSSPR